MNPAEPPFRTTRRSFLVATTLGAAAAATQTRMRPNILFIMPDQLRACALGYMGNEDVHTPNIDRLASESVVLPNTFANTPVCCPARANILSGTYAHRNGMVANDLRLRESVPTMSRVLHEAGYRTGFIGKWHLDGGPRLPGFIPAGPRRHGFEFWAANECSHAHFNTQYFRDSPDPIRIGKFEAEAWTDLVIEFLRETQRDHRPFFLSVQMGPPHDPYKAPLEYAKLYDPGKLRMRPNWEPGAGLPGPAEIAQYYGMISAVDHQVGRMISTLNELGIAENTIVLLSSDHGDMLGSQGRRLKRKPWDESIRVPGLIRYPRKIQGGRRSGMMFSHVDFAPTLLGLAGVRQISGSLGADVSPALTGGKQAAPDSVFLQIFGPYRGDGTEGAWRGVRTQRYTYACLDSGPWVLYDNEKDPYQQHNLIGDRSSRPLVEEMEKAVRRWRHKTGDSSNFDWKALVEDEGRLYNYGAFYTVEEYLAWERRHPKALKDSR
jgi:arylsulfatase A-like enzyme